MSAGLLAALITSGGALLIAVVTGWLGLRTSKATSEVDRLELLLGGLQTEVTRLSGENDDLREDQSALRLELRNEVRRCDQMERLLTRHGITP